MHVYSIHYVHIYIYIYTYIICGYVYTYMPFARAVKTAVQQPSKPPSHMKPKGPNLTLEA